jgi:ferredoxin--NADP+ reductase
VSNLHQEQVIEIRHWTDRLFSFKTTRSSGFRFQNGQFTMIGLPIEGKPLLRAYSMASSNYEETLEFFSIKVPNGPLTSKLQHIRVGDEVLIGRKPTGTLVQSSLTPGRTLYLVATGTGLAPFLSIIKDPDVYERYERVVLIHGCRFIGDLAYSQFIEHVLPQDEFIGELVREKLVYYPTVTREPFRHNGRVTHLFATNRLTEDLGLHPLDPAEDRVMICGGPGVLADMVALLEERGFAEGSASAPGAYVIEKAFVEK